MSYNRVNQHTAITGTVGLWQLDETLNATIGTTNFVISAGTAKYTVLCPKGPKAFLFDGATRLIMSGSNTRITGPLSVLWFQNLETVDESIRYIINQAGTLTSELEADNILFAIRQTADTELGYISEHGAGIDDAYSMTDRKLPTIAPAHMALVREQTGSVDTIRLYVNSNEVWSASNVTRPTGGSSSNLYVGGSTSGNFIFGAVASIMVVTRSILHSEISDIYDQTLGVNWPRVVLP
jgi:hypothetical protein